MKKTNVFLIIIIMALGLGGVLLILLASQPCTWLDLSLNHTGCIRQLDVELIYGNFATDLSMLAGITATGMEVWRNDGMSLHTASGQTATFSYDNAFWVQGSLDRLYIWDTEDWTLQNTLDTNTRIVTAITIAPDLSTLAVVGLDGSYSSLQVWQRDGVHLHNLEGHTDYILSVDYSPDGTILASSGEDDTIRLWRVKDGRLLRTLKPHSIAVEKVIFSPDGLTLASASWDGAVQIWQVENGKLLHILNGHDENVFDIAYSPDSSLLASASGDGTVKLWDVRNGVEVDSLTHNWLKIPIDAVAFSPDGKVLATVQRYGPVRFFDVQKILKE